MAETGAGANDPDEVIGESRMGRAHLDTGHVTGRAIFRRNFAGRGSTCGARSRRTCMALKAGHIVSGEIAHKRLVRIVAGDTGDALVSLRSPAQTSLKAIGLKTCRGHTQVRLHINGHVYWSSMTSATEIDRCDR